MPMLIEPELPAKDPDPTEAEVNEGTIKRRSMKVMKDFFMVLVVSSYY